MGEIPSFVPQEHSVKPVSKHRLRPKKLITSDNLVGYRTTPSWLLKDPVISKLPLDKKPRIKSFWSKVESSTCEKG